MWSQWYFSLSIWQVHLGLLENIKCIKLQNLTKKMQMLSETYAWNVCVNVRERICFMFHSVCLNLVFYCSVEEKETTLLMLRSPSVALSVFYRSLSEEGRECGGETVTIHVYMFTQGHSKMCCFFILSVKFTYLIVAFYCGIIQSGIIIQYCTILFQLLMKKKKKV